MGLMKIKDYAEKEGISVQAVHKRVKNGGLNCKLVDGIKHIVIDDDEPDDSTDNSTDHSTLVKPDLNLKQLESLKKDNENLRQERNDLKVENAMLEERVKGKEEIIENLKEQHSDIVKALGTNSEDLRKTIGTLRDIQQRQIEAMTATPEEGGEPEVENIIQPGLISGLNNWFNPVAVMTGLIVVVSVTFALIMLYILGV